jgi:hypothetical protein
VVCRAKLEANRKKHEALKERLEGEFGKLDSLEAKVARLEDIRRQEEVRKGGEVADFGAWGRGGGVRGGVPGREGGSTAEQLCCSLKSCRFALL